MQIDLLELPVVIMYGALFAHARFFPRAWEVSKRFIDAVERDKGILTPCAITMSVALRCVPKSVDLDETMLRSCSEKGAWMTNGEMRAVT